MADRTFRGIFLVLCTTIVEFIGFGELCEELYIFLCLNLKEFFTFWTLRSVSIKDMRIFLSSQTQFSEKYFWYYVLEILEKN